MQHSDIIIIGGGPGGYKAAEYAAKHGRTVTLFEQEELGGTCLNSGCIPTKTFCRHAAVLRDLQHADTFGIKGLSFDFRFPLVQQRKQSVVAQLRQGIDTLLTAQGVTVVRASASFVAPHTVMADGEEYSAQHIIIATGSQAKRLAIEGAELDGVMTSTEMLNIDYVPKRLCIVGAGVVGMEMASCFAAFGSDVTVIEYARECLPMLDSDLAKRLRKAMPAEFHMQSAVSGISRADDGSLIVAFEKKGKPQAVAADAVLLATGRMPNTDGLNLDAVGVAYGRSGIQTDNDMRTTVPHIYAIGDCNGRCMLAHAATMQGIHVVNKLLGIDDNISFDIMPSAVFTMPEAGCVGLSEDQCRERGISYICRKAYYRANGKALAMNETEGMLKIMADSQTERIIGCHVYGAHAADIVQEVSALMCKQTTLEQLHDMVHIHPTLSEILHEIR